VFKSGSGAMTLTVLASTSAVSLVAAVMTGGDGMLPDLRILPPMTAAAHA
jgi:hypothetical protein